MAKIFGNASKEHELPENLAKQFEKIKGTHVIWRKSYFMKVNNEEYELRDSVSFDCAPLEMYEQMVAQGSLEAIGGVYKIVHDPTIKPAAKPQSK